LFGRIFQLDFNPARAGMPECIGQSFAANAVNLVANHGMQCPGMTFNQQPKIDGWGDAEFLGNSRECLFKIIRGSA
jgi:hypothetical protein